MDGDGWLDQIAAKAPEPCERAILVGASEPAVADDICYQNRRELPALAHCVLRRPQDSTIERDLTARAPPIPPSLLAHSHKLFYVRITGSRDLALNSPVTR